MLKNGEFKEVSQTGPPFYLAMYATSLLLMSVMNSIQAVLGFPKAKLTPRSDWFPRRTPKPSSSQRNLLNLWLLQDFVRLGQWPSAHFRGPFGPFELRLFCLTSRDDLPAAPQGGS
ncbi:hypothetical protein BD311DRAFT_155311 [Dichomitus squalens]|uniref:Uncharacterized protein n=1 Tax=Dichomitus squalens TaxID=114155 RepID=A0A4Q9M977_9APHY|nr:hypothetical protein BD311DRAFT_155311 [Dichomitus squalens]